MDNDAVANRASPCSVPRIHLASHVEPDANFDNRHRRIAYAPILQPVCVVRGKLTARTAKEKGLEPILAGRNEVKLKALCEPLGFQFRAFDLSDKAKLYKALGEVDAVLHIAGPFSATSKPMADACLRTGTHYLDITGEIDVFEALAARDAEATKAGFMLLPGVGFDVVPSDCLALHLKQRMPDAIDLKISIGGLNALFHGTAKSMVEGVALGLRVRRDGRIITPPRPKETLYDFGEGPRPTIVIPWGDVSTAYYSTGIPNIEVRMAATPPMRVAARLPALARKIVGIFRAVAAEIPNRPHAGGAKRSRFVYGQQNTRRHRPQC